MKISIEYKDGKVETIKCGRVTYDEPYCITVRDIDINNGAGAVYFKNIPYEKIKHYTISK